MRIFMRVATAAVLAIGTPFVLSACAVDDTPVITVCDLRPTDRVGTLDLLITSSGAEYFIITPPDGSGVREGFVYEINVESSKDTGDLIVEHKQLDEKAEPCL